LERPAEPLGLKKNVAALLGVVTLMELGERLAERFLPLYLMALGGGAFSVGLLNGLDNLLSALYSYPGGYISDKLGYRRAMVLFNSVAMAGYVVVIVIPSWQAVILGAILFVSWSAISLPATMEMLASVLPKTRRTMGVSLVSMVKRVPKAFGPVIGGVFIGAFGATLGVRYAFVLALILAGVSLLLLPLLDEGSRPSSEALDRPRVYGFSLLSGPLRNLLVSDILVRFCEQIPYAFVVIWCVTLHRITPVQFGILTLVEMVTAMLVYIPVARMADRSTKKPFVVMTFGFFTVFPLVLLFAQTFWVMVVAFVIRGLKEFGEPTRKALIMDLAPEERKAATFGLYYLVRDVIVAAAAFGGALLWDPSTARVIAEQLHVGAALLPFFDSVASPTTNFLVAVGFGLAGTIYFAMFGRDLGRA